MRIINSNLLEDNWSQLKFLLNKNGILFFPITQQHRDVKMHGLSYEDDYKGNALAGILQKEHVEIRYHEAFSDQRVLKIWTEVARSSELEPFLPKKLLYQGRLLQE